MGDKNSKKRIPFLGVKSIVVAIMFSKADVVYDNDVISAAEIRDAITDLGYPSQILEDTADGDSKIDLLVSVVRMKFALLAIFRLVE